ncbi:ATRN1 protein, partial [Polypterus senegalus]
MPGMWKDRDSDNTFPGMRKGCRPGVQGSHKIGAGMLHPVGARGHRQGVPEHSKKHGLQHFRHNRKCWKTRRQIHPVCFRVLMQHFRHTRKCCRKFVRKHLEHIRVLYKRDHLIPFQEPELGGSVRKFVREEWRRPEEKKKDYDKAPVTDTNIPSHMEQMLDILIQEENERESGETGPCMEYLLHHKILETLYTLGKADCPPGMKQQVLLFYTKLLGRIKQPLLPHINVHRPVQKLIRLCGEVLAAPTENEEIQFLCIVCAKLKQDPYLVSFFLEDGRIVVKACEGLLLLASLPEAAAAKCLMENTALCELLTDRLTVFYKALPQSMDPLDIETVESEIGILTSTALLNRIIRQVSSAALLQETVFFILGEQRGSETTADIHKHILRHRLIEHCDHLSDEISIMTLRLFEHLLQKPNEHILYNLVLRNLEERNYTEYKPPCQEDKDLVENGQIAEAIFLCLVPDEAKSSYQVEGTGYDTYLRDAHRQFRDYCAICMRWDWPGLPKAFEKCDLNATFYEGHFLKVLFDRMGRILDQVVGDLMLRIQRIPDFTPKLLLVRKRLLGLEPEGPTLVQQTYDICTFGLLWLHHPTSSIGHRKKISTPLIAPTPSSSAVVGIGKGTKMLSNMLKGSKKYTTVGEFGKTTDTLDATGKVTEELSYDHIKKDDLIKILKKFSGNIMQVPPLYSALKKDGQRLSVLVKKGLPVEAKPARPVMVFNLELQNFSLPLFTLGPDCSLTVPSTESYWVLPNVKPFSPSVGRASHKAIVHGKFMWVIGGYTFNYSSFQMVLNYNIESSIWNVVQINGGPLQRYGHSLALYQDDIYMYGGKIETGNGNVTDELWVFNIPSQTWTTKIPSVQAHGQQYGVEGHSAHIIEMDNGDVIMVIIFGYSAIYGYISNVQEYNIRSNTWLVLETKGAIVQGGYGHSSVYDSMSKSVYVHGGYKALPASKYGLVDDLYKYEVRTRTWTILKESGLARYLHSAVIISGAVLVFGGNTHNDTSLSNGAKCFSADFLAYDIACDEWRVLPKPNLHRDVNRFGHSAVVSNGSMYVFGGFSSVLLNDILVYNPPNCEAFRNEGSCLSAGPAHLCGEGWNHVGDACLRINSSRESYDNAKLYCYNLSGNLASLTSSKEVEFVLDELQKYTVQRITPWVGLRKINISYWGWEDMSPFTNTTLQWLPGEPNDSGFCAFLERAEVAGLKANPCTAMADGLICEKPVVSPNQNARPCKTPCSLRTTCNNCTSQAMECMWCSSTKRCVDSNAYVISFPYGQCLEWQTATCPSQNCSGLRTCTHCLEQPGCGWCNDPSNTGKGQCIEGSSRGPMKVMGKQSQEMVLDQVLCPKEKNFEWAFIHCPACQCNGHSTCVNSSVCEHCRNLTTGMQCEACMAGFYGDPTNGGKCQDSLLIDYQFTFSLLQEDDRHYTAINFMANPEQSNKNLDMSINASNNFNLNITWSVGSTAGTISGEEIPIVSKSNIRDYRDSFSCEKFSFRNNPNITFYVYVSNFSWPIKIQVHVINLLVLCGE